jgi:hypothetical protein
MDAEESIWISVQRSRKLDSEELPQISQEKMVRSENTHEKI